MVSASSRPDRVEAPLRVDQVDHGAAARGCRSPSTRPRRACSAPRPRAARARPACRRPPPRSARRRRAPGRSRPRPPTVTRPSAISRSAARREATPAWARNLASRIAGRLPHCGAMDLELLDADARRARRAALPRPPGVGVGRPRRARLRGDDEPAARAARGARGRAAVLVAAGRSARRSAADGTEKALFETADGRPVEAVLMRYRDGRRSLCLSSQSGCPLTCTFCATGRMSFGRNLTASEILDQALHFRRIEAVEPRGLHGDGRAAHEPRRGAGGLRAPAGRSASPPRTPRSRPSAGSPASSA